MILYFSATGNGKYISEQIAGRTNETCMSIVDCIREDKYSFYDEEILGIVVPTYFWRLPRIVAEYLDKLRIENCGYTFFLASYGTTTGKAGSMAKDIMAHHGQKFNAYYSVVMPDTWTPVFDLTDKKRVDKWLSDGKNQLELVIDNIISKRKGDMMKITYINHSGFLIETKDCYYIFDYYAATLEMLLEKCFFTKEQLSREEALQAVRFLLGSVEKEAHKK